MLTRYIPRGGATVLDLNVGGGRHLYYLPEEISKVVALNPSSDSQLLRAQGEGNICSIILSAAPC